MFQVAKAHTSDDLKELLNLDDEFSLLEEVQDIIDEIRMMKEVSLRQRDLLARDLGLKILRNLELAFDKPKLRELNDEPYRLAGKAVRETLKKLDELSQETVRAQELV